MLYTSLFLFIVFLFLWFITLPGEDVDILPGEPPVIDEPVDEPVETIAEKLERIEKENRIIQDNLTYMAAVRMDNRAQCEFIYDSVLRAKCLDEVEGYEEIVIDTRSEDEVLDDMQLLIARRTGDLSYCDTIKDSDLKDECLALVQEE